MTAPGGTTAWRQVVIPAGVGVIPIDVRLTRRRPDQVVTGAAMTISDAGDGSVTRPVDVALAAASLQIGRRIALTSIGAQALPGLLPPGWSPLAAAEIAIDASAVPIDLPASRLAFTLSADEAQAVIAAAQTFSLVQYDNDRDEWRVVSAVAAVGSDRRAAFDIVASGDYALVYPDRAPGLPSRRRRAAAPRCRESTTLALRHPKSAVS